MQICVSFLFVVAVVVDDVDEAVAGVVDAVAVGSLPPKWPPLNANEARRSFPTCFFFHAKHDRLPTGMLPKKIPIKLNKVANKKRKRHQQTIHMKTISRNSGQ